MKNYQEMFKPRVTEQESRRGCILMQNISIEANTVDTDRSHHGLIKTLINVHDRLYFFYKINHYKPYRMMKSSLIWVYFVCNI